MRFLNMIAAAVITAAVTLLEMTGPDLVKTMTSRQFKSKNTVRHQDFERADAVFLHNPRESDNTMTVRSLWDRDSLYFRFDVTDCDLRAMQTTQDHPKLFLDDMVEILMDPRLDRTEQWIEDDFVYHINVLEAKKDDRGTAEGLSDASWNGEGRYEITLYGTLNDSSDTDNGYTVILALPWSELGLVPRKGLAVGVNFANGDNDGNGRQLYDWCDAWPLRSPCSFGVLVLKR